MHLASPKALLVPSALAAFAALVVSGCAGPLDEGPTGETRRMPLALAYAPLSDTARGPAVAD
jgi:hypothetical protein